MIFSKEEEVFSTVNTSNVSASEEDNATENLPDSSTKEVNDNSEVGQGKPNAKRKLLDKEAAKV